MKPITGSPYLLQQSLFPILFVVVVVLLYLHHYSNPADPNPAKPYPMDQGCYSTWIGLEL